MPTTTAPRKKKSGRKSPTIRTAVGAPGGVNPSSSTSGSGDPASSATGAGVRDSATARPTAAPSTTNSPSASRTKLSDHSARRRWIAPITPTTSRAVTFRSTSAPYREPHSGAQSPSRTAALATPLIAVATKQPRASRL